MRTIVGNNFLATEIVKKEMANGIVAPDTAKTQKMRYKVELIGEDIKSLEVGDTVYVAPKVAASRHTLIVDDVEYTVFSEDNIIIVERD